jgi:predicted transposase YdaD
MLSSSLFLEATSFSSLSTRDSRSFLDSSSFYKRKDLKIALKFYEELLEPYIVKVHKMANQLVRGVQSC